MTGEETAKLNISIPDIETQTSVTFTATDNQGAVAIEEHQVSIIALPNVFTEITLPQQAQSLKSVRRLL
ncbi:hypothetical protein [Pseudoalteromonas luteoviolacea]|uniref:Bacterial Ig-like domain-containing protein n=1 Tax=Pseudoalteromonas luteoviolacea NCIMB 1942 TaxID=1365253 RepID=A0A167B3G8_9GAMM|nr:hypothetical protein [Pseudoalteromonas luteoviolacea]KZN46115.1 hypothetical protein N482_02420 [Pseudoalteromonas luteoviolacea NCIMB 1942]KZW98687.1 hypothetical protein JL49_21950 [Pseudoalteromonas luteoviolacea]